MLVSPLFVILSQPPQVLARIAGDGNCIFFFEPLLKDRLVVKVNIMKFDL